MAKNKQRNIGRSIKTYLVKTFRFLGTKTWFFTVLFFTVVLIASVWIWWQCVYRPQPSAVIIRKIESEKEDFDQMRKKTAEAITLLQGYRENYYNASKFENQRELFIDLLDQEVLQELQAQELQVGEDESKQEGVEAVSESSETTDKTSEVLDANSSTEKPAANIGS